MFKTIEFLVLVRLPVLWGKRFISIKFKETYCLEVERKIEFSNQIPLSVLGVLDIVVFVVFVFAKQCLHVA